MEHRDERGAYLHRQPGSRCHFGSYPARAMAAYGDVARGIKLPQSMINAQLNKIKL